MTEYDITVCIPVYNSEDCIERAIRSIISQTTSASVEILVCDDGSTDASVERIKTLQAQHPNIRLLSNEQNSGRPYTRSRLVENARGTFLTWLDADDEKYPSMLQLQFEKLQSMGNGSGDGALHGVLVYTNFHWLWPTADSPKLMTPPETDYSMEDLLNARFGGYLWLMMGLTETFRTVGPFDQELPRLQDLDFFIRFVQKGGQLVRIDTDEPQCIYYKDDQKRAAWQVWTSWGHIWNKHRLLFYAFGYDNAMKWRLHHYRVARRFAKNNDDKRSYYAISAQQAIFIVWMHVRGALRVW